MDLKIKKSQEILDYIIVSEGFNNHKQLSEAIGFDRPETIYKIKRGQNSISKKMSDTIKSVFPQYDCTKMLTGEIGATILKREADSSLTHNDEFRHIPVVVGIARAGYMSGYDDPVYIESLPKMLVPREYEDGDYIVFEIEGDSLDDNTNRSLCDGDKVLGKKLAPMYWKKKLQFERYLFIIVSNKGIACKQITSHDLKNNDITCHSFNDYYEDYDLKMKDIYQIFYVKKIVERKIKF